MRTAPLLVGLVIGFTAATLPACGPTMPPCSAATCALGCCDSAGKCQSATNSTCGRNGSSCSMCSVSESCVMGTCQSGNVGAGTAGGSAGGGNATGGGSSSSEYSAFLTTFSNAYCQKAIDCGSFPASAMADCQALLRQLFASYGVGFRTISTERSVLLGATAFDAVAAQRCLTDVAAFQCAGSSSLSDVCVNSVRPAAQTNGACFTSTDCVDSRLSCNGAPCSRRCIEKGNLGEGCKQGGICNAPFSCIDNVCWNDFVLGMLC